MPDQLTQVHTNFKKPAVNEKRNGVSKDWKRTRQSSAFRLLEVCPNSDDVFRNWIGQSGHRSVIEASSVPAIRPEARHDVALVNRGSIGSAICCSTTHTALLFYA
jgi:hypothetical protein